LCEMDLALYTSQRFVMMGYFIYITINSWCMPILNFDISNMSVITTGFCSCLYVSWIPSAFRILVLKTNIFANVIVSNCISKRRRCFLNGNSWFERTV